MKKLFLFLFLIFPLSAFAVQLGDNLEVVGFLKTEVWVRNNLDADNQYLTSFKNTADVAMEYTFSDNWALFFHPRYYYDFAYGIRDAENFDRNQDLMGHTEKDEWVRDCYLDYTSDNLDIRLGKQQVVWGAMDVPILDIVMPLDLKDWFLPDMADIRMPLWMGKFEYSAWVDSTAQLLIIPDFEQSQVAPPGAPLSVRSYDLSYAFQQSLPVFPVNNVVVRYESPPDRFQDYTFGFRWRSMIGDLEYTLNWLSGYSRSAYAYLDSANAIGGGPVPFNLNFTRRHKRIQASGFSFAKTFINPGPFEGITLKGEFVYIQGEPTYYGTSGGRAATEASDKYNWGIALEKNVATNWLVSFQFLQFIIDRETFTSADPTNNFLVGNWHAIDSASYGVIDKIENYYVIKVMTDFMHERLKPEITCVLSDDNHGRIIPKVTFELRDNIWLKLGYAHFFGSPDMNNGQFRNRDQVMLEVKTTF